MIKLVLLGALSCMGLFACLDARDPEPGRESTTGSELSVCCQDFECVATGFATTGCNRGRPNITQAHAACNEACAAQCVTDGLYCD